MGDGINGDCGDNFALVEGFEAIRVLKDLRAAKTVENLMIWSSMSK